MILDVSKSINRNEVARYTWNNLRRFHNIEFCAQRIIALHGINKKYHDNVRKQATQIRQCLIQAEQYFKAAESVGLATKPVLLYYGVLSFALSEILLKQDGRSSLDSARGQHAHHGLDLKKNRNPSKVNDLSESAAALRATPLIKGGNERFGTFELWHRSQRDSPAIGVSAREFTNGGRQQATTVIAAADDKRSDLVPEEGLSLLDCLRAIPKTWDHLALEGVKPSYARGRIASSLSTSGQLTYEFAIHPADPIVVGKVLENFKIPSRLSSQVEFTEMPSGCLFSVSLEQYQTEQPITIPSSLQYDGSELFFFTSDRFLNEFGNLYVSLFILGNYARYFPDEWMVDIEKSSNLSLASYDLMEVASERIPLLILNELTRIYHFYD